MRRSTFAAWTALAALAAFATRTPAIEAQTGGAAPQRVIRVKPFGGTALQAGELAALQKTVTSQVVELRAFRVIDSEGQEGALAEAESAIQLGVPKDIAPLTADYLLSAEANGIGGFIVLTMDLTKVSTGEKRSVSESFSSSRDLLLAIKRMTLALFEREAPAATAAAPVGAGTGDIGAREAGMAMASPSGPAPVPPPAFRPNLSLGAVAGTWQGDKNVATVVLYPDGRGKATLSNGAEMRLKVSVSGSNLVVAQDQPTIPDFYIGEGITAKAAKTIARSARPWRWIFSLTADGDGLVGVKESVFVSIDARGTVKLDNSYSREARWTRVAAR